MDANPNNDNSGGNGSVGDAEPGNNNGVDNDTGNNNPGNGGGQDGGDNNNAGGQGGGQNGGNNNNAGGQGGGQNGGNNNNAGGQGGGQNGGDNNSNEGNGSEASVTQAPDAGAQPTTTSRRKFRNKTRTRNRGGDASPTQAPDNGDNVASPAAPEATEAPAVNPDAGGGNAGGGGSNAPSVSIDSGNLGGEALPVLESGDKDRPFLVNGNTFANAEAAVQRSCDIQFNKCADAANSGQLDGKTLQDCDAQKAKCGRGR